MLESIRVVAEHRGRGVGFRTVREVLAAFPGYEWLLSSVAAEVVLFWRSLNFAIEQPVRYCEHMLEADRWTPWWPTPAVARGTTPPGGVCSRVLTRRIPGELVRLCVEATVCAWRRQIDVGQALAEVLGRVSEVDVAGVVWLVGSAVAAWRSVVFGEVVSESGVAELVGRTCCA